MCVTVACLTRCCDVLDCRVGYYGLRCTARYSLLTDQLPLLLLSKSQWHESRHMAHIVWLVLQQPN